MSAREETKRAGEALAVAIVVGVFHLIWLSDRFATEQGSGGITLLLGCTFTTALLWAMLALRTIANDGPPGPEVDDGLTCMAVTAWVMALVPPRASNFLQHDGTDDFTYVYVPLCLFTVFAMLAAQKIWPAREEKLVFVRLLASASVSFGVVAVCVLLSGGDDAKSVAMRAGGLALASAVYPVLKRK